jgi:hypothetical protein
MTMVYDMVSGQFITDESNPQTEQSSYVSTYDDVPNLQLITPEDIKHPRKITLPADLAYQVFLLTE